MNKPAIAIAAGGTGGHFFPAKSLALQLTRRDYPVVFMTDKRIEDRALLKMIKEDNPFIILATTGIITGFGLQAFINMASTLHLIPTKGMTLPFISYGGSSAMSVALAIGMVLALTRHRIEAPKFSKNGFQPFSKRNLVQ